MRILWFTNIPLLEEVRLDVYSKGSWLFALSAALAQREGIELGIVSIVPGGNYIKCQKQNIKHYIVPSRARKGFNDFTKEIILHYSDVIDDFKADLVHIHGTEKSYGLLSAYGYIRCPVVITIQGLIHVYLRHYYGGVSFSDTVKMGTLGDWLPYYRLASTRMRWQYHLRREIEIIKKNRFFICKTLWDKAHLLAVNPDAKYFHCDELLRPEFYRQSWDISRIRRHSIFVPTASYPLKGFHWVLRAAGILKRQFPDLLIRVADSPLTRHGKYNSWLNNGYAGYLKKLIRKFGLEKNTVNLGILTAQEMAGELLNANVFIAASLVENWCTALQEAMLVGTPSVVSCAGGMPSLARDGKDALFFPAGDEAVLAEQVRNIFNDDALARDLSEAARKAGAVRNAKEAVVNRTLEIYEDICNRG